MKNAGFRVRIEKELRQEFVDTCRLQGKHAADVLRNFMRDYVQRESGGSQGSLFESNEQQKNRIAERTGKAQSWAKRS